MPNRITLEIGTDIIIQPIKGTAPQIRAAILRYAIQDGIDTNGKAATEIGADVLKSLLKIVRDGSLGRQRIDLLAAQQEAMEAQLASDNDL